MTNSAVIEDEDLIAPELSMALRRIKLTYGYYKKRNGYITVSPMTQMEELKYRRMGWEPLPQYGRVEMGGSWAADHPFENLFMHGGAKEMPLAQVIENAFHINPPTTPGCGMTLNQFHKQHRTECFATVRAVRFPQLDGMDIPTFSCRFCEVAPFPVEAARNQHETVVHKEERKEIRAAESLTKGLSAALKGETVPTPDQPHRMPYACGVCEESFTSPFQLTKHVKESHTAG